MRLLATTLLLTACSGGIGAAKDHATDADEDGYPVEDDCDDGDAAVHPGATEVCNDIDDDCDGLTDDDDHDVAGGSSWYADADGDGYGDPDGAFTTCEAGSGVTDATDCDDGQADVHPAATETCSTTWDDDCDGDNNDEGADNCSVFYADVDGDGYGGEAGACVCLPDDAWPAFYADDCDDDNAAVNPDASEICDDGIDNDCDEMAIGCSWEGDTSLDDSTASILGATSGAEAGSTLLAIGDLDGDGKGDLVMTAPGTTGGLVAYFGGPLTGNQDTDDASGLLTGSNEEPITAVAGGGDLDGDGVFDLLVSSLEADGGAGATWIWSAPDGIYESTADLAVRLSGDAGAKAGVPVIAGDLDGDGYADLGVSATWDEEVILVMGPVTVGGNLSNMGHRIVGATGGGTTLASIGDTDGDGLTDLTIGSPDAGGGGKLWVVLGPGTGVSSLGSADAALVGTEPDGGLGTALCSAGDLDGDGLDDLLVGAPDVDLDGRSKGVAYVFLGPVTGSADATDVAWAVLDGEYTDDRAGAAVSGHGDVNGDGHLDLALGAPGNDQVAGSAGLTYIMYGPITTGTQALKFAGAFFEARQSREYSGTAVDIGSDFDGDGIFDVAIGAPGYDGDSTDNGVVEVFTSHGL